MVTMTATRRSHGRLIHSCLSVVAGVLLIAAWTACGDDTSGTPNADTLTHDTGQPDVTADTKTTDAVDTQLTPDTPLDTVTPVDTKTPPDTSGPAECVADHGCAPAFHCVFGQCVEVASPDCTSNAECGPKGDTCVAGRCACGVWGTCDEDLTCVAGQCGCATNQKLCDYVCISASACCGNGDCWGGSACKDFACVCPGNAVDCDGQCIAAGLCCHDSDCATGQSCLDNVCKCPANTTLCGGACVSAGGCCANSDCGTGGVCSAGVCSCNAGATLCDDVCIDENACCIDDDCSNGTVCDAGLCVCPSGEKDCAGACIPTGDCCEDADCSGGTTCQTGSCACPAGQKDCSGACIPSANCCDAADCATNQLCGSAGACISAPTGVVISELVYDVPGADDAADTVVFIEIAGPSGTSLEGLELVGVDGATGVDYGSMALTGGIGTSGTFLIVHPNARGDLRVMADQTDAFVDLQDGGSASDSNADAVQLRFGALVVDAVGYGDGVANGHGEGDACTALSSSTLEALSRDGSNTDTDDNAADFAITSVPSPGGPSCATANACGWCGTVPAEACSDGVDNDCDGDVDTADADCP